jgi:5-methylcytosine-specific restriction endonuclease McrA
LPTYAASGRMLRRARLRRVGRRGAVLQSLDALLRDIVLYRDGHRCRKCGLGKRPGRGGGLQAAHIIPKGAHPALRYHLDNVILLHAYPCHLGWWHKDPVAAVAWARSVLGNAHIDRLELLARIHGRSKGDRAATRIYLEAVHAHYLGLH